MVDLAQGSLLPNDLAMSSDVDEFPAGAELVAADAPRTYTSRPRRPKRASTAASRAPEGSTDPVLASLLRLEVLVATLTRVALQPVLEKELKDPAAQVIYEATGEKTAREIASTAGVGLGTVSRTWARWAGLGLVVKDGTGYRRAF